MGKDVVILLSELKMSLILLLWASKELRLVVAEIGESVGSPELALLLDRKLNREDTGEKREFR